METTEGTLLDGRLRYAQPASGFRSGIEPVLLAASVPAKPGELVLEAGTGAGAALLCLAARVPIGHGLGIEQDAGLAALARANAAANALPVAVETADILTLRPNRPYDHALANPPYHPAAGTASPDRSRSRSKRAEAGLVAAWAAALGRSLRPGGTLTLILLPSRLPEALRGCEAAGCGSLRLLPLWPKAGRPARLMIVHATRLGRAPLALLPGLVLHEADGRFTEAADAILRHGAALAL